LSRSRTSFGEGRGKGARLQPRVAGVRKGGDDVKRTLHLFLFAGAKEGGEGEKKAMVYDRKKKRKGKRRDWFFFFFFFFPPPVHRGKEEEKRGDGPSPLST